MSYKPLPWPCPCTRPCPCLSLPGTSAICAAPWRRFPWWASSAAPPSGFGRGSAAFWSSARSSPARALRWPLWSSPAASIWTASVTPWTPWPAIRTGSGNWKYSRIPTVEPSPSSPRPPIWCFSRPSARSCPRTTVFCCPWVCALSSAAPSAVRPSPRSPVPKTPVWPGRSPIWQPKSSPGPC